MKVSVTENKLIIQQDQILNENEYNIHKIEFDFSSEYTDDLVKVALFTKDNLTYKKIISNNECDIPPEILQKTGYSILGVYAYKTEQDTLILRYSPTPTKISVFDGSYKAEAENSEPITPSEIEQYQQILQNSLQQFESEYQSLVQETQGDISEIEAELQRKVDEGYFDGEDGFSPIATVTQLQNGARIQIEDKNGTTTADVLNGADGYTPQRGVDYWTEEDKEEIKEESIEQIDGKLEEYNANATQKTNAFNSNAESKTTAYNENATSKLSEYNTNDTQKTTAYNSNAESKTTAYNENATSKLSEYNTNDTQKTTAYNSNAEAKTTTYNQNAASKLNTYNENHTTKLGQYNTNATEKTNTFNTNATNKLNAYNTNAEQKITAYNQNANEKTQEFDEHTEQIQNDIEILQRTDDEILSNFNKFDEVTGENITLNDTTEIKFAKPPLPMGNSEQESTTGKQLLPYPYANTTKSSNGIDFTDMGDGSIKINGTSTASTTFFLLGGWSTTNNIPDNMKKTVSIKASGTNNIIIQASLTDVNGDNVTNVLYGDNETKSADITTAVSGYIRILIPSGVTINNAIIKPYIVEGTYTTATFPDYEPYTNGASPNPNYEQPITNVTGDVEVKVQNKNLLDKTIADVVEGYINSSGEVVLGGTSSVTRGYIPISPNIDMVLSGMPFTVYAFYDKNKNFIERIVQGAESYTFNKNAHYIRFQGYTSTFDIDKVQLEKGSTSTPYTSHKEQTFTFPLGNEKLMLGDYLADDGIHHVRGQAVFDGSEPWYIGAYAPANSVQFLTSKPNNFFIETGTEGLAKIKSSHFINQDTVNGMRIGSSISFFPSNSYNITTVEDFKTWLSTHNVIVEYELQEEVIVPYTSAQKRVYNEIKNAYSYDEMTIITGSSDGNKPFFIVQTYKDLNKELNNKVDKVQGKELSSNDFTDTLKEKLEGLENYDDTEIKADISDIQNEQIEQNTEIEKLQEENARLKATLLTTTGEGKEVTLNKTAELEFIKPPLPMGNSEQESTNNLLYLDSVRGGYNDIEPTLVNGIVHLKGTNNEEYNAKGNYRNGYVEINTTQEWKTNTTYYISCKIEVISNVKELDTSYFNCFLYGGNDRPITKDNSTGRYIGSITTPASLTDLDLSRKYVEIRIDGMEVNISEVSLKTVEDYTFDGYGIKPSPEHESPITNVTGDVEVKVQNKNHAKNNSGNLTRNGITFIKNNDGSITANGTATADSFYVLREDLSFKEGETYTLSGCNGGSLSTYYMYCYNIGEVTNGSKTTTLKKDFINRQLGIVIKSGYTANNLKFYPQLEKNSTSTPFTPHKEQVLPLTLGNIELCKIGDYQDYFYKESNKWYLHKEIRKVVFDGSNDELWAISSTNTSGYNRFTSSSIYNLIKKPTGSSQIADICSNYFIKKSADNTYSRIEGISVGTNGNLYIYADILKEYTLEQLKIWLSTHNTIVYYILATPADTEITDTTLISQLEAINNAINYEEQTNISSNTIALFNVEAYQSTKLVLEEMATAIVALGGV